MGPGSVHLWEGAKPSLMIHCYNNQMLSGERPNKSIDIHRVLMNGLCVGLPCLVIMRHNVMAQYWPMCMCLCGPSLLMREFDGQAASGNSMDEGGKESRRKQEVSKKKVKSQREKEREKN